jgi:hypothetical protein
MPAVGQTAVGVKVSTGGDKLAGRIGVTDVLDGTELMLVREKPVNVKTMWLVAMETPKCESFGRFGCLCKSQPGIPESNGKTRAGRVLASSLRSCAISNGVGPKAPYRGLTATAA